MIIDRPDPLTQTTLDTLRRFNDAFNRQDIAAVMAEMDVDCVFENTYPPPDGERSSGFAAVQLTFSAFFESSPHAYFEFEEIFAWGERACQRWTYRWVDASGSAGHVRGVDVLRIRGGKILEKFSYVKG